uniref:TIR domain containing adaptor protein n=1 Tax=Sphenodon punctatus TaxID=8508 RepID=A0A8D0L0Q6_SPHPU
MAGWLWRLVQKPRQKASSPRSSSGSTSASPSSPSARSSSSSAKCSSNSPRQLFSVSQVNVSSLGSARWSKEYDVCICHSEGDIEFVVEMVSYLESQTENFRCFLQLRDSTPGSAVTSELCDAVQNSHCWVMLITPNFLQDPWCTYQMHQALVEAPMANGRIIPVVKDIDRKQYPRELKCIYYINVTIKETSFQQVKNTVLNYLQKL